MSTITTPRISMPTGLPTCPWWCTARPEAHAWQLDRQGAWTRTHAGQVGGFTMSATELASRATASSRIEMHPTQADFVLLDGARRARPNCPRTCTRWPRSSARSSRARASGHTVRSA